MNCALMDSIDLRTIKNALRGRGTNLVYGERALQIDLERIRSAIVALDKPLQVWFINEHVADPETRIEAALCEHGGDPALCSSITSDVANLYRMFIDLTGDQQPFLSLRSIDASYFVTEKSSVSSLWHRDSATLTLFTTYLGYGTQWTPNTNVKRDYFVDRQKQDANDPDNLFLHDHNIIITTAQYGLGILKGELKCDENNKETTDFLSNFSAVDHNLDFNVGGGLIHRGPSRASTDHRLLLTISTFVVPAFL